MRCIQFQLLFISLYLITLYVVFHASTCTISFYKMRLLGWTLLLPASLGAQRDDASFNKIRRELPKQEAVKITAVNLNVNMKKQNYNVKTVMVPLSSLAFHQGLFSLSLYLSALATLSLLYLSVFASLCALRRYSLLIPAFGSTHLLPINSPVVHQLVSSHYVR